MTTMTSTPVTEALNGQGTLRPGQEGWWKVYGAQASDVQAGDLIMVKPRDAEITEHAITRIVPEDGMRGAMFLRFIDAAGEDLRIGRLCPVIVLRKGTQNTLAGSI
jgi:hypothetical protein